MIKLFPESKRPWSDALSSVQDHRNPYEIYFGLFGGGDDDGDSGGGGGQIGADDFADEDAGMMDGPSGSDSADDGDSGGGGFGDGDFGQDDSASDATAGAGPSGPSGGSDAVSDALDAALSDDIGDYSADDTTTDLADTLGFSGYTGDDVEESYGVMDAVTGTPDTTSAQEAVNAGFVTSAVTGRPINTSVPGNYVTQANATPEEIAAAYAALSQLPGTAEYAAAQEAQAAQLAADQELGFMSDVLDLDLDVPTEEEIAASQIDDIFSTDPMSSGYQTTAAPVGVQDIQAIDELSFGPPAQVTSFKDPQFGQITQTTNFDLMGRPTSKTTTSDLADFSKTESYSYGPNQQGSSSNVDPNYSMTPADQLDAQYGMPAGYFAGLDDLVDDDFAAMGNRPGPGVEGPGTGYTDQGLPVGLEFATHPQTGAQITTNLAGLTEEQLANQPFSMDVAQFIGSSPYGYELDPVTGNPIGQVGTAPFGILGSAATAIQQFINGPPETVQDLIEQGAYTGMTGQNNDGFGGGEDSNVMQQAAQVDPCPAGYELDPATNQCMPIDVVAPFQLGRREYGPTEMPSLLGTPVSPFQSQLRPTAPDMSFFRPAVNPFGFARGGIVELPKK